MGCDWCMCYIIKYGKKCIIPSIILSSGVLSTINIKGDYSYQLFHEKLIFLGV